MSDASVEAHLGIGLCQGHPVPTSYLVLLIQLHAGINSSFIHLTEGSFVDHVDLALSPTFGVPVNSSLGQRFANCTVHTAVLRRQYVDTVRKMWQGEGADNMSPPVRVCSAWNQPP